jgi:hypothetical protein
MAEKYTNFKSKVAEETGLLMDQSHVHAETTAGRTHL